jgi:hypothetical protein
VDRPELTGISVRPIDADRAAAEPAIEILFPDEIDPVTAEDLRELA